MMEDDEASLLSFAHRVEFRNGSEQQLRDIKQ
jgi:hypothetical protein